MAGITGPFGVFRSSKNENETESAAGTTGLDQVEQE